MHKSRYKIWKENQDAKVATGTQDWPNVIFWGQPKSTWSGPSMIEPVPHREAETQTIGKDPTQKPIQTMPNQLTEQTNNENNKKLYQFSVPLWQISDGETERMELHGYIKALKYLKQNGIDERYLIYESCIQSKRDRMFNEDLDEDQKTNLDKFIKFLEECFSVPMSSRRRIVEKLTQSKSVEGREEPYFSWLGRVRSNVLWLNNMEEATLDQIEHQATKMDEAGLRIKREIVDYFISGVLHKRTQIRLREDEDILKLSEIAKRAMVLRRAFGEEEAEEGISKINLARNEDCSRTCDEDDRPRRNDNREGRSRNKSFNEDYESTDDRRASYRSSSDSSRSSSESREMYQRQLPGRCYRCGRRGHYVRHCRSPKLRHYDVYSQHD